MQQQSCLAAATPWALAAPRQLAAPWALAVLLATGCTAPATEVHNPAGHRVFVDGRAVRQLADGETTHRLPFRYYGTSRWDAQPGDLPGTPTRSERPDWQNLPASGPIEQPAPVSPWLFPFDLPLELLSLALHGRDDFAATVVLPPVPETERVAPATSPAELDRVAERARGARAARTP